MEQTVKERLIIFIKKKGLSHKRFETAANLSIGYISNLRRSPSAEKLVNIFNAFPELNKNWLLNGEGEMLNQISDNQTEQKDQEGENQPSNGNSEQKPALNNPKSYDFDVEEEINRLRHEVERLKELLQVKDDEISFYRTTIASALKGNKKDE